MLLGKNLGGGHQRHLIAGLQCLQCGKSGDHGLACADIALHQAQHRLALAEVVGDFRADALLCAGGGKAQVGQVLLRQGFRQGQRWGLLRANAFAQALQRQLVSQQFLEGQAVLGPVAAFGELFQVGIRWRSMQIADGLIERAELVIVGQLARQPIRQALRAEARQGLFTELTQALLGEAFGGRVDRRQGLFHGNRFAARQRTVFRVINFQTRRTRSHFTVAAHLCAAFEAFFLRLAEMIEAQGEGAAAVLQAHEQAAPPPHDHIGAGDYAFYHGILARP